MRTTLNDDAWIGIDNGAFVGPDGEQYWRRSSRMKRAAVDKALADGAHVVVRLWSAGELSWHEGTDAADAWMARRRALVSGSDPQGKEVSWTAELWDTESGLAAILLDGHC